MKYVVIFSTGFINYFLYTLKRNGSYTTHPSRRLALKLSQRQAEGFVRRQLSLAPHQPCPPRAEPA